jgi:hypothetical protein
MVKVSLEMNPCQFVLQTAEWVVSQPSSLRISQSAILKAAAAFTEADVQEMMLRDFDGMVHYVDENNPEATCQFLLFLDAAFNFCFWPDGELEYDQVASGLKKHLVANPAAFDCANVLRLKPADMSSLIGWAGPLPLEEERCRLMHEVAAGLIKSFDGKASNLVEAAKGSCVRLVSLLTSHFPGFRDHAIYGGRQCFFLKRAQIFAGDVYGALGKVWSPAKFQDVAELTAFADYRLPQLLRSLGILLYNEELARAVDAKEAIAAGSTWEVEIRAATVVAVERLKDAIILPPNFSSPLPSYRLDWQLWHMGERSRTKNAPHHRTLTMYY